MKRTYRFKSLLLAPVHPGEGESITHDIVSGRTVKTGGMAYDLGSVRDHVMSAGPLQFLFCRSWVPTFFLTLMVVSLLFGVVYAILVIGLKVDFASPVGARAGKIYIIALVICFAVLWLGLGIPAAVKRLKRDHVVAERGKGNWVLVDEDRWERFYRIVRLSQEEKSE
ncbi:MAG: hypothetical protein JW807_04105 [Spirochaetes bacterium]|nr:hypothetical protein [Spirochaetota bacterium]